LARAVFADNFPHAVLTEIAVNPLAWPEVVENDADRCCFCKKKMYTILRQAVAEKGCTALADGTNADDLLTARPGLRAIRELQVVTPLAAVGLTKAEVRLLARREGLTNFALPSNSCLATRVQPGDPLSAKALSIIEQAEDFLHSLGFWGCRVRLRPEHFLIEVQKKDLSTLVEEGNRALVQAHLRKLRDMPVILNLAGL
jgi:uncharacterized protein